MRNSRNYRFNREYIIPSFLLFLMLLSNSCHPLFCNWDSGYEQLTELSQKDTIVGEYRLTKQSTEYLKKQGYSENCKLKLLETGEYEIINAPDLIFGNSEKNKGKTINAKGKWFSSCAESYDCMLELERIAVIPIARKNNGAISLLMTIGDGDECEGIIFERVD